MALTCTAYAQSADFALMAASDGGYRYFEIASEEAALNAKPSQDARVQTVLTQGTLLSNLGCRTEDDALWCEVVPLGKKRSGFLKAASIRPASGPDQTVPKGPDDSKTRAQREDFDFDAQIKCAQVDGQSLGHCDIQIARSGGGDATAIVTFANGFSRELYFTLGEFTRASATMSGVGRDVAWSLNRGTYRLRVDDQRFEMPAAFILGTP